jgi:hypothetical protein
MTSDPSPDSNFNAAFTKALEEPSEQEQDGTVSEKLEERAVIDNGWITLSRRGFNSANLIDVEHRGWRSFLWMATSSSLLPPAQTSLASSTQGTASLSAFNFGSNA